MLGVLVVGHLLGGWYLSGRIRDEVFEPASGASVPAVPDAERVTYPSPLGDMDAWYVDGSRSQWIVHVHGNGASPGQALEALDLRDVGFPQLAIAYRNDPGEPADPSGLLRYGRTEWEDLRAAIDFALAEGASGVVLVGHAEGAAVVLATLTRDDTGVLGAVLDSPYVDLSSAVDAWAARTDLALGIPIPPSLLAMGKLFTELRLDLDWSDFDALRDADRLQVPLLVFHGTDDAVAPIEESRALVERRPQLVTLVEVEGVGHEESRDVDPDGYRRAVLGFLIGLTR